VKNLGFGIKGTQQIQIVSEQYVKKDIWTEERSDKKRLEKKHNGEFRSLYFFQL
jgi:hypothetical protein